MALPTPTEIVQRASSRATNRVRISGSHFEKCEGILGFCEELSQRNNRNAKLSISFLVPKFHLVTIIFKQDNILQKHLISWHDLILQPPRQVNFRAVYMTSFMFCFEFFIFLSYSVLYNRNRLENCKTVSICLLCTLNILVWKCLVWKFSGAPKMFWIFWSNKNHGGGQHTSYLCISLANVSELTK